jgi:hypothetical protein
MVVADGLAMITRTDGQRRSRSTWAELPELRVEGGELPAEPLRGLLNMNAPPRTHCGHSEFGNPVTIV